MSRSIWAGLVWMPALLLAGGLMPSGPADVHPRRIDLPLAGTSVPLVVHGAAPPGLLYISLHDDEDTAVQAVQATLYHRGGQLFELRHTGERNIQFMLDGKVYTFDPNRIFTEAGVRATLAHFGASSAPARRAVHLFAEALLQQVEASHASVLVAVHNNTEGRYSIQSYAPGGSCASDAERLYIAPARDPDDFFLVTDLFMFEALRTAGFNVVWQSKRASDDGSLSVYAAQQGMSYVNVEAQRGHLEAQQAMLEGLHYVLSKKASTQKAEAF